MINHSRFVTLWDGLIGPTHNFGGLALGNRASLKHRGETSSPRRAALQGLQKMRRVLAAGHRQGFFPPQERPMWDFWREQGFSGTEKEVLEAVARTRPDLLVTAYSASSMWAANAAVVSPSVDTGDGRVHFSPANLALNPHRTCEVGFTAEILKKIFPPGKLFHHHAPLSPEDGVADEGAANTMRLAWPVSSRGIEVFVYGFSGSLNTREFDPRFLPRQSWSACSAHIRRHALAADSVVILRQNPDVIAQGVFHNDVIAVDHENLLFFHEKAYVEPARVLNVLKGCFERCCHQELGVGEVPSSILSCEDAVSTYLFNSEILTQNDGSLLWLAPLESQRAEKAWAFLKGVCDSVGRGMTVEFVDLSESMRNGGGPACLRLRVPLTREEQDEVNPVFWLTASLADRLEAWIQKHFRDELTPADLADFALVEESRAALEELTGLLGCGPLYPFQRN